MGNPHNIQVGQVVYVEADQYRRNTRLDEETVKSVGRKWAVIGPFNQRFDIETLWTDGRGYSGHKVWLSAQDYENDKELKRLWSNLARRIHFTHPLTDIETTRKIAKMLNLNIEDD